MRSNAASAWVLSGGKKRHVHRTGHGLAVFQPIRDQAQRKGLHSGSLLFPRSSVSCHARQGRDVGEPSAIFFPEIFDGQGKPGGRVSQTAMISRQIPILDTSEDLPSLRFCHAQDVF